MNIGVWKIYVSLQSVMGYTSFVLKNMMVVNKLKTKVMVFGKKDDKAIIFNGMVIQNTEVYKYLGNIIRPTTICSGDILKENSTFLCDKARKAIFGIFKKLRKIGTLPPKLMLYIFDTLIKPILLYGSDVWDVSPSANNDIDKVLLWFLKCILKVKSSTSNDKTLGEVGAIPPSVQSHIMCWHSIAEWQACQKYNCQTSIHGTV